MTLIKVTRKLVYILLIINALSLLVASASPFPKRNHRMMAYGVVAKDDTTAAVADSTAVERPDSTIVELPDSTMADTLERVISQGRDSVLKTIRDSIFITNLDSITVIDTLKYVVIDGDTVILNRAGMREIKDSLAVDTTERSSSSLDAPVEYTANDSITFDYETNRANLYGEAQVNYTNLELGADLITMSLDSSIVHAVSRRDSLGNILTPPTFKQGGDEYEPDEIAYNFKTRKAFVSNVYTQQGEGYLISSESKRDSTGTMYFKNGKYTTCDAKHPHFYMALTKGKMRPGKDVVFGPAYLVVEDVPLPLALPYGFFPFTDDFSSGLIMPTYGDETTRGFYLRDGGYYFAISDKIDLKVLGEIYTKGSWGLSAYSNYRKRYRFSGSINISYQNTKEGEKNMPDYNVSKSFKFQWSHRQDAKANPSQSFSASVNFATSSYEQNNLNSMYNPQSRTQSTRTSSISYSKSFSDIGLTISTSMNLSQNMRDSTISITLPSLNITLARFNPFKRKKQIGKERWYEKIAMSYTGTLSNSISTKENKLLHSSLVRDWRNGFKHDIPISASFALFNYINITPSFNFTDRMYSHKVNRSWNTETQQEVRDTTYGFYNVFNYNVSMSASTKLYGMYTPIWGKKIVAIRHVFTPTVSFSYAPDFGAERYGYWGTYVKTDANGNVSTVEYSPYQGMLYGVPSKGMTGNVAFDISNNLEMKVRADRDSTKKISLIDELGASMSYNMAAKVKPWSNLSTRLRLKLTKSYTFSMNAVFATYAYEFDQNGNIIEGNHTEYSQGRFGRFQGMSQNFSYTFNNQTFSNWFGKGKKKKDRDEDEETNEEENDQNIDSNMDPELSKGQRGVQPQSGDLDEDGYLKFKLPWSFSISYGVNISENRVKEKFNAKRMRYPYHLTHTLNFSGNIRIASGWDLRWSSGYDFNYKKLSMTTASISRDLHCFNMSCSVVLAPYTSFNFTFQCNSSVLADALKWKKHSNRGQNITWY